MNPAKISTHTALNHMNTVSNKYTIYKVYIWRHMGNDIETKYIYYILQQIKGMYKLISCTDKTGIVFHKEETIQISSADKSLNRDKSMSGNSLPQAYILMISLFLWKTYTVYEEILLNLSSYKVTANSKLSAKTSMSKIIYKIIYEIGKYGNSKSNRSVSELWSMKIRLGKF